MFLIRYGAMKMLMPGVAGHAEMLRLKKKQTGSSSEVRVSKDILCVDGSNKPHNTKELILKVVVPTQPR